MTTVKGKKTALKNVSKTSSKKGTSIKQLEKALKYADEKNLNFDHVK